MWSFIGLCVTESVHSLTACPAGGFPPFGRVGPPADFDSLRGELYGMSLLVGGAFSADGAKNLYSQPSDAVRPGLFPPCRVKKPCNTPSIAAVFCLAGRENPLSCLHHPVMNTGSKKLYQSPRCADWRANFLTADAKKAQEYCVYFKVFWQRQAENLPSRCVRRLLVQLLSPGHF